MRASKWPTPFSQKQNSIFQKKTWSFCSKNLNHNNFGRKIYCEKGCLEEQTNFKIFSCFRITKEETEVKYEIILNSILKQKIQTFQKFKEKNWIFNNGYIFYVFLIKLYRVDLVDNRPSTDKLQKFKFCYTFIPLCSYLSKESAAVKATGI